jgi:hypothetical protein
MLRAALEGWEPLPLQDALKTAREAVGALGDSAGVSGSAPGDDKASLAAQIAALRQLQAAQKGLQGQASTVHLLWTDHNAMHENSKLNAPITGACCKISLGPQTLHRRYALEDCVGHSGAGSSIFPGGAMRRRSGSGSGSGDGGEDGDELAELARSIDRAAMPPHVHKVRKRAGGAAYHTLQLVVATRSPQRQHPLAAVLSRWRCGS